MYNIYLAAGGGSLTEYIPTEPKRNLELPDLSGICGRIGNAVANAHIPSAVWAVLVLALIFIVAYVFENGKKK